MRNPPFERSARIVLSTIVITAIGLAPGCCLQPGRQDVGILEIPPAIVTKGLKKDSTSRVTITVDGDRQKWNGGRPIVSTGVDRHPGSAGQSFPSRIVITGPMDAGSQTTSRFDLLLDEGHMTRLGQSDAAPLVFDHAPLWSALTKGKTYEITTMVWFDRRTAGGRVDLVVSQKKWRCG